MNHLGVLLLPLGWDVSPSQGNPAAVRRRYSSINTPGWRETKWSEVPCLWKQRDRRGLNHGPPYPDFEVLTSLHQGTGPYLIEWNCYEACQTPSFLICFLRTCNSPRKQEHGTVMGENSRRPLFKVFRGTQREYSSKPLKHSIVSRLISIFSSRMKERSRVSREIFNELNTNKRGW